MFDQENAHLDDTSDEDDESGHAVMFDRKEGRGLRSGVRDDEWGSEVEAL